MEDVIRAESGDNDDRDANPCREGPPAQMLSAATASVGTKTAVSTNGANSWPSVAGQIFLSNAS